MRRDAMSPNAAPVVLSKFVTGEPEPAWRKLPSTQISLIRNKDRAAATADSQRQRHLCIALCRIRAQ